jgi:hypothetical protein
MQYPLAENGFLISNAASRSRLAVVAANASAWSAAVNSEFITTQLCDTSDANLLDVD